MVAVVVFRRNGDGTGVALGVSGLVHVDAG